VRISQRLIDICRKVTVRKVFSPFPIFLFSYFPSSLTVPEKESQAEQSEARRARTEAGWVRRLQGTEVEYEHGAFSAKCAHAISIPAEISNFGLGFEIDRK